MLALADDALTLRTDGGAARTVDLRYAADHLEHGYALTGHAAQGATVERAFVLLRDQGGLREWGYVACSRARAETHLYLADAGLERESHGREPARLDVGERVARALSASASEPLAMDQLGTNNDTRARMLAARRQHLDQARARAAERLAQAEAELEQLSWRGRRAHSAELRTEIAMQRAALRLADQTLAEPIPALKPQRVRAARDAIGLARECSLEDRLAREAPQRSRGLEREGGFGIEL